MRYADKEAVIIGTWNGEIVGEKMQLRVSRISDAPVEYLVE